MNYELAKKLKDNGFPQTRGNYYVGLEVWDETMQSDYETSNSPQRSTWVKCPTLSELIEACGKDFINLHHYNGSKENEWVCNMTNQDGLLNWFAEGSFPEEAVANLWLSLNNK